MYLLLESYNLFSFYFRDVAHNCQLEDKELRRTLQSIVDVKILTKEPQDVRET